MVSIDFEDKKNKVSNFLNSKLFYVYCRLQYKLPYVLHRAWQFIIYEPRHEISNNMVLMCDQQSLRSACAVYAQADQRLCKSLEYSMTVKLLPEQHLEFLSLKGGCTGSSEFTLVKLPHCWKSDAMIHMQSIMLKNENLNKEVLNFNKKSCLTKDNG